MKRTPRLTRLAVVLGAIAAPATALAQLPSGKARGPASAVAVGFSLPSAPSGTTSPNLVPTLISPPKQAPIKDAWALSSPAYIGAPNFSLAAIFGVLWEHVHLDGHSSGNDIMPPLDEDGIPRLGEFERWMGVIVSVDNEAQGLETSLVRQRRDLQSGRTTPGADLISFYLSGSVGIDPSVAGETFLEQAAEDLGYGANNADLDALDLGLGIFAEARRDVDPDFFPRQDDFYFSITQASALAINGATGSQFAWSGASKVPANGATIYRVSWYAPNSSWGDIYVHRSHSELGLSSATDEIDAIAVDTESHSVIYSTQPFLGRSQLMIHGRAPNGNTLNVALKDTDGNLVTAKLGLRDSGNAGNTDNVDVVCVIEPEIGTTDEYFGTPESSFLDPDHPGTPMGMSTTRYEDGTTGLEQLVVDTTGWGDQGPIVAIQIIYVSADYGSFNDKSLATWFEVRRDLRFPTDDTVVKEFDLTGVPAGTVWIGSILYDWWGNVLTASTISRIDL